MATKISPSVMACWKEQGVESVTFHIPGFVIEKSSADGMEGLPGFRVWSPVSASSVSGLVAPDVPFGLFFQNLDDEGARELRGFSHLVALVLWGCPRLTDAGVAFLESGHNLQSLKLGASQELTAQVFDHLGQLQSLRHLYVYLPDQISDASCPSLASLEQLSHLTIQGPAPVFPDRLTAAGVKVLSKLAALRELSLPNCRHVNDEALQFIGEMSRLQRLNLSSTTAGDEGCAALARLHQLVELNLASTAVGDDGVSSLARLSSLATLNLHGLSKLTDRGIEHLARLSSLKRVRLSYVRKITSQCTQSLARCAQLEELQLSDTAISDESLPPLRQLLQLRSLELASTSITDEGARTLSHISGLRELNVSETKLTSLGVRSLAALSQLTSLDLNELEVQDADLEVLAARLPRLRHLGVAHSQVTARGLRTLSQLAELESLHLYQCVELDDGALLELAHLKRLRRVNVYETQVSEEGLVKLRHALPDCEIEY